MIQTRNAELVDLLRPDVQARYEPNFAWKSAISTLQALPGLRGAWSMATENESGNAYDVSGQGRTLTYNGNPTYNYSSLIHYIALDGTGDYLSRADEAGLDILGTETYVASGARGLTLGGWFYFTNVASATEYCLCKYDTTAPGQRSYALVRIATGEARMFMSSTGAAATVADSVVTLSPSTWYFLVGRYIPSTEVKVWVNGDAWTNVVAIPASIFNSTSAFYMGSRGPAPNDLFTGRASLCFLSTIALSDAIVSALFHQTRSMFNV